MVAIGVGTTHAYDPSVINCHEHDMGDCPYHVDKPCQFRYSAGGEACGMNRLHVVHGDPTGDIIIAWVNDDLVNVYAGGRLVAEVDWDGYGSTMPRALEMITDLAGIFGIPVRVEGRVGR